MVIGVVFAVLYVLTGAATYYFGPRIGPNPVFGVRTTATLADRRVWDVANRHGGLILVAMGLGLVPVAIVLGALDIEESTANWVIFAYVMLTMAVLGWWAITRPPKMAVGGGS